MTDQEFKIANKQQKLEFLNPLIQVATDMILAGFLVKNVIRHFTNKGLPVEVATNLTEVAKVRAENYSHYKHK